MACWFLWHTLQSKAVFKHSYFDIQHQSLTIISINYKINPCKVMHAANKETNELTPWSKVLIEKLTFTQPVKEFPTFYVTRKFITTFATAHQWSLS
jgi:hypothetical protein